MAQQQTPARPGRSLAILALAVIGLIVWAFWPGVPNSPQLGLDLRGGTQVILKPRALNDQTISDQQLQQTVEIIRQRVNGLGVAEAEVSTQGSGNNAAIIVSIPGVSDNGIAESLKQTALLDFRAVEAEAAGSPQPLPTASPSASASGSATAAPSAAPSASASASVSASASASQSASASASPSPSATGNGAPVPNLVRAATTTPSPSASATAGPTTTASPSPSASPTTPADALIPPIQSKTNDVALQKKFLELDCSVPGATSGGTPDDPAQWLVTCSQDGKAKYLLQPAFIRGTNVTDASAALPQGGTTYTVNLSFDTEGQKKLAEVSQNIYQLPPPQNQFAIVLDSLVVSSPYFREPILGGTAQIEGSFTQQEAKALANVLKYGALPLTLDLSQSTSISPTLGDDQLKAGIAAGLLGLILVALYLLLYYRALGLVAVFSLVVAGIITYCGFVVLGRTIGFTLTLAGIAGAIVAIGITADSFIVYFERIRDEIRDGRTLRAACDAGWVRARRTILAADFVSLLAAVVLYLLSVGGVRGFAFTLGMTTLIDIAVAFLFTRPVVSVLARNSWFAKGGPMTGLDPQRLGVDSIPTASTTRRRSTSSAGKGA
ncbi:MAG: protein translocase subunit SecD [Actinomycetes bacterium]